MFFTEEKDILAAIVYQTFLDVPVSQIPKEDFFTIIHDISEWLEYAVVLLPDDQKGICLDFPSVEAFIQWAMPIKDIPSFAALGEIKLLSGFGSASEDENIPNLSTIAIQDKVDVQSLLIKAFHKLEIFQKSIFKR